MITLDPTSYEVASNMKNFSGWVRKCLRAEAKGENLPDAMRQRAFWKDRCVKLEKELEALKNE